MRKFHIALLVSFFILASAVIAEAGGKIIYIPLDNRPVCLSYVQDTVEAAGYKLSTPPEKLLSNHKDSGDIDGLWKWLEKEAPTARAAVLSTDSLNYGGLVASRKHEHTERFLNKKVARIKGLREVSPAMRIFAFSTIMRTPRQSAGNVEPDYYQFFGPKIFRLSQLQDKEDTHRLSAKEVHEKAELMQKVPGFLLNDWFKRREKNYSVNEKLIDLAKDKTFHFLAIGKDDDAPLSQTHMESRHLNKYAHGLAENKFQIIPGVDQVGLLLITRAINELTGDKPTVHVIYAPGVGGKTISLYSDQSVQSSIEQQIAMLNGKLVNKFNKADLVLAVNTPYNGENLDSTNNQNAPYAANYNITFAKELSKLTKTYPIALADISFANGADNGFMLELDNRKVLPNFKAYSGWNTADNSIGYALAQGLLSQKMKQKDITRLLKTRYIDDWMYQANVRLRLANAIDKSDFKLKYDLGKYYNRVLGATNGLFKQYTSEHPYLKDTDFTVEFPWNRLFEVDVKVE